MEQYSPSVGRLSFGEGCVDDAEDSDVIHHERGHGLHDWVTAGGLSQVDGLSEGCGDYVAQSYNRSLGSWTSADPAYNWVFIWDGHNECWGGRSTAYNAVYPDDLGGSIHTNGQMWASTLMTIWDEIGQQKTDKIFYEGLGMTNEESNQNDAANAVYQAAINLNYTNTELTAIHSLFSARGYTMPTEEVTSPCVNGSANGYPCDDIDLVGFMSLTDMGCIEANDIWGWTDPQTGKEYAIFGCTDRTTFIDISTPTAPVFVGSLATHTTASSWRDMKVYADHAFIVSEASGHGMQIFDLNQLRNVAAPPATFTATAHLGDLGNGLTLSNSHNIVINEESGFAYTVGNNICSGGLTTIDISNPTSPVFTGCFSSDGYTHDAQCVNYIGPDGQYTGQEICFNSNENTLTIVDVTDKTDMTQISRTGYAGQRYTHQGWLTDNQEYFLMNDELDETNNGHNTRTHIWDVRDLDNPVYTGYYQAPVGAIDHNLYIIGDLAYLANYRSGLRILNISDIANANLVEVAYFDTYPASDSPNFNSAWSSYPYFASGNIIVSDIEQGLFILKYNPTNTCADNNGDADGDDVCADVDCDDNDPDIGGIGSSCEDGNLCTQGETIDANCNCTGGVPTSPDCDPCGTYNFNTTPIIGYDANQDFGPAIIQDGGATVYMDGNTWKAIEIDFTVTPNTVIQFDFKSTSIGEIHEVGFDNDLILAPEYRMVVYGNQGYSGDFQNPVYSGSGDWETITFDIGTYFTGTFQYLVLSADDDEFAMGNSYYRSITLFEDADDDLICDFACEQAGNICDDNDACTTGDAYDANCNCTGIFQDADNDGICDADDICDGNLEGQSCDDNDACTTGDVYDANCNCAGTFQDADNDSICDADDTCPNLNDALIGTACDDGDPTTTDDAWGADCACTGTPVVGCTTTTTQGRNIESSNGIQNCSTFNLNGEHQDISFALSGINSKLNGKPSSRYIDLVTVQYVDVNGATQNHATYTSNGTVNIAGPATALIVCIEDNDGSLGASVRATVGTIASCGTPPNCTVGGTCDDGDTCTTGDVYDANCNCAGTSTDADDDGVCAANDPNDNDPCVPNTCSGCTTYNSESFEINWGIWNDGGNDVGSDALNANTGTSCVRLRDNSGQASSIYTDVLDLSTYNSLDISFSFITSSMETGEDFFLEMSTNGGSSYTTIQRWISGTDFTNGTRYNETVTVSGLTNSTVFRIRCDASANNDRVYIDDVVIEDCSGEGRLENNIETVNIFPNPSDTHINVDLSQIIQTLHSDNIEVNIFSLDGKRVYQNDMQVSDILHLNIEALSAAQMYLLHLHTDDGRMFRGKFLKF